MRQRAAQRSLWDQFWRDRRGKVVIFEWPNVWLIGWALLTMISLFTYGVTSSVFSWLGILVLSIWAIIEAARGVNYFRRLLGLLVLLFSIASAVQAIR